MYCRKRTTMLLRCGQLIGVIMVVVLVVTSLIPVPAGLVIGARDKLIHFFSYYVISYWWFLFFPNKSPVRLAIGLFLVGTGLEMLQGTTAYRTLSLADIFANGCGITLALLSWRLITSRGNGLARKPN